MKKIALIGAGNIGGTVALLALVKNLGSIVLYDIVAGMPQGKALDLSHCCPLFGSSVTVQGTNSISDIAGSDVCIVTAGLARKPGMSRNDLVAVNSEIIKAVSLGIKQYSPNSFVIVVSNPLDAMVSLCQRVSEKDPKMVVGMAGVLDSSRYRAFLSDAVNVSSSDIEAMVLGGHGDEMVPIRSMTKVNGAPVDQVVPLEQLRSIEDRVRNAGAEIVSLLKTGSGYYSPAAAVIEMAESYLNDKKKILPAAAMLNGEYGISGLYVGVPTVIGAKGVERIVEVPLTGDELQSFMISVRRVQEVVKLL